MSSNDARNGWTMAFATIAIAIIVLATVARGTAWADCFCPGENQSLHTQGEVPGSDLSLCPQAESACLSNGFNEAADRCRPSSVCSWSGTITGCSHIGSFTILAGCDISFGCEICD